MGKFLETDKFQKGDVVTFYSDTKGALVGIVTDVKSTDAKGVANKYEITVGEEKYTLPVSAFEKVRMTSITVELNTEIRTAKIETREFYSVLTNATNYASDKMDELKKKAKLLVDNIRFAEDWETKMAEIKSSYDYWEKEYAMLQNLDLQLKVVR